MSNYDVWRMHQNLAGNHWDAYLEDTRKNGDICAECGERYRARYHALICPDCTESMVRRIDRRPECNYKHYVYALFASEGVVYVGVTKNPHNRLQDHIADKDFSYMALVKGFSDRAKAEESECFCIEHYRPHYNRLV